MPIIWNSAAVIIQIASHCQAPDMTLTRRFFVLNKTWMACPVLPKEYLAEGNLVYEISHVIEPHFRRFVRTEVKLSCSNPNFVLLSHEYSIKIKCKVTSLNSSYRPRRVFTVKYEHNLHIKELSYPRNSPWRPMGVLPVRYEHNLHIKSKAIPVTERGGP
jgi:hypothetical protein